MTPPIRLDNCPAEIGAKTIVFGIIQTLNHCYCVGGVMTPPYDGVWNSYAKLQFILLNIAFL